MTQRKPVTVATHCIDRCDRFQFGQHRRRADVASVQNRRHPGLAENLQSPLRQARGAVWNVGIGNDAYDTGCICQGLSKRGYFFNLSKNFRRNLATLGAMTTWQ